MTQLDKIAALTEGLLRGIRQPHPERPDVDVVTWAMVFQFAALEIVAECFKQGHGELVRARLPWFVDGDPVDYDDCTVSLHYRHKLQ
jgi:hypothetical protein